MPTVLRIGPYRLFFVSLDYDEPPHIPVKQEDKVAKSWLDPVSLQKAGGFSSTELSRIARLVNENRVKLLESWNEFFGT